MKSRMLYILVVCVLVLAVLAVINPTQAQVDTETPTDEPTEVPTVEPTPEVTEEPTEPDVVVITPEDFDPLIGLLGAGLAVFLGSAGLVMSGAANILITFLKWWFPERQFNARQISLWVLIVFSALYLIGEAAGVTAKLQEGVDFLTAISGPIQQIILLFGGSAGLYKLFAWLHVPALGDKQGESAFSLEPQR